MPEDRSIKILNLEQFRKFFCEQSSFDAFIKGLRDNLDPDSVTILVVGNTVISTMISNHFVRKKLRE